LERVIAAYPSDMISKALFPRLYFQGFISKALCPGPFRSRAGAPNGDGPPEQTGLITNTKNYNTNVTEP
jgi:hypothetical protein